MGFAGAAYDVAMCTSAALRDLHLQACAALSMHATCMIPMRRFDMPQHVLPDDPAVERKRHGGEQRRCSVALVVAHHGSGAALLDRQPRPSPIEQLIKAVFVGADTQTPIVASTQKRSQAISPQSPEGRRTHARFFS